MKSLILAIVILAVAAGMLVESRYKLVINPPIVAKLDRLTGDIWIANAGTWRKIQNSTQENNGPVTNISSQSETKGK